MAKPTVPTPVPTVTTDLLDYAPGSTAVLTASNFIIGSTLEFQVLHVTDPGSDGLYGTLDDVLGDNSGEGHEAWYVTDGVRTAGADGVVGTADDEGDLDGVADGNVVTNWYVNPDDSLGATFMLTARGVEAGADGLFQTADDIATGEEAAAAFTDTIVDLTSLNSNGAINGARFANAAYGAGTGLIDSFLRIQANNTEHGYNTDANPLQFDAKSGTEAALLNDNLLTPAVEGIPIAFIGGVAFREFRLDINENTNSALISLDALKVYLGNVANLTNFDPPAQQGGTGTGFGASAFLVYDMDAGSDSWVKLNSSLSAGSGKGDMSVFIPDAAFKVGGVYAGTHVYLYSAFGYQGVLNGDNWRSDGGFEEWSRGIEVPIGVATITGSKFEDLDADGVKDGNEGPIAGVTIFFDKDGDNQLDWSDGNGNTFWDSGEGEQWTTTNGSGVYTFANLAVGLGADSQYVVREVSPTGYIQSTPNPALVDLNPVPAGSTVTVAPFGNTPAVPPEAVFNLEKLVSVDGLAPGTGGKVWDDADTAPGPSSIPGEDIYFRYELTSLSAQPVTINSLVDNAGTPGVPGDDFGIGTGITFSGGDDGDNLLEAGETWIYYSGPFAPVTGQYTNTGTATGTRTLPSGNPQTLTTTDDANYFGANPALNIVKDASVPGGTADAANEVISYTITVANTGNTTLTNVVVTDPYADVVPGIVRGADVSGDNDALLEVGETWGYTAQHTVTQAEIDSNGGGNGLLENTATADSDETGPDTDDASVPVARNSALNIVKDASVPGGTADAANEVISYTITVANTGNTTLTNVVVTDPYADVVPGIVRGADVSGDNDALLEVGETWGYTAQHTVTQAEIDSNGGGNGLLENTATADSDETGPDTDDASVPVARNSALNIVKDASVPGGTADAANEVISYTITVANTGNTTLTNVVVTDPYADVVPGIVRGADVSGDNDALLEVGETWGYTAQHTVTQAEIDSNGGGNGLLENTATADSDETGPDTDDASVPVARNSALNIVKDASVPGGTADAANEVISYTITVANTGNTTLTNVVVTDPYADVVPGIVRGADVSGDNDALLEVGETWGYTAQHTVTQAEIDSNGGGNGLLENTATADSDETGPDTDDASVPVARNSALNIVKDASVPGGTADAANEVISYTITVANTGNTTLTNVVVTDPYADVVPGIVRGADVSGDNDALLEVGETWGYTAQHTVTQAEIDSNGGGNGLLENTATADSDETGPDTDDASVPVARNSALNIVKDASVPGGTADAANEVISYTITVANTGNTTLTNVVVTDPYADVVPGIVRGADVSGDNDALLEVGETWGYTAQHTVTQAEIDSNGGGNGLLENTATADSDETGPDTDDASVPVARNSALNIVKDASVPGGTADAANEVISYTITVANTGNTTLTNVVVTDPYADVVPGIVRGADVSGDNDALLEVGETWGYTAQHTVTQAEIDSNGGGNGLLENTATADSDETGPDTDDASVPVARNSALNIVKDASVPGGTADAANEVISYTITVANTGNTTLTNVVVTDPYADVVPGIVRGADVSGDNDALLEVGETWGYTAQHTVTQAEIDSNGGGNGLLENTATADSDETGPDTDDASVPVARNSALNIVKDASVPGGTADAANEVISYTITVANTGNTTLTNVVVTDPYADVVPGIVRGADVSGDNDALLEVGETWGYTAQHTVTQAEIDSNGGGNGLLENTATADSDETGPDTDDASVPVARNSALNIVKDASVPGGTADAANEVISYTITVANTGNTTLTNVVVTDPYADVVPGIVRGADVSGDNDALLEVGETWGYTAQHTVTQAEIDSNGGGNGLLENTATADSDETGPDTDDASVPVARNSALNIVKDASVPGGTADAANEVISYTITVANTGNTTLTNVVVTDPYADVVPGIVRGADVSGDNDALLEVGETWGYTAQHTVTQAEIDSNGGGNGLLENTATADSDETGPDTDDASVPVARNSALNIVKDASVPGGTADAANEVISYTITVANTGNTTLTNVVVTDPYADVVPGIVRGADVSGDNDALLEVGETWGYTAQHTVTQAEIDSNGGGNGLLENTATADSDETGPDTDDASVPVARNSALNIVKDASVPGGTADAANEVISYTITVANTGNTTLTNVVVTDPYADVVPGIVRGADVSGDNDALLEVGETWGYTAQHTVTQAEIDSNGGGNGLLENTATADSDETGPDTDDASVPVARNSALNIVKDASVPGGTADAANEVISYTITVANTGNTTLTNVVVTDPYADVVPGIVRGADVSGDNDALLEVGETWGYTAQHTVTQAEIDSNGGGNGLLENTATADSDETGPDTDDASVPVARNSALNIVKDASVPGGTADAANEVISYTITVANTGNTTLTNVVVTDPYADVVPGIVRGADVSGDNDALLEVGETWGYTAQHTVTQAEIDSNGGGNGLLENTATADSDETGPDTDDASVPVARNSALNIVKDASVPGGTADAANEVISYTITVANTGNTTLTNVVVTDPYADVVPGIVRGADVSGDNDALLEVGETWGYTAQHTVTQAEIDSNGGGNGLLENTATADSDETGPDTDDASVPVEQLIPPDGLLDLQKYVSVDGGLNWDDADLPTGPSMLQSSGDPQFKFVLTNLSNVTAEDVVLSDTDFDLDGLTSTDLLYSDLALGDDDFTIGDLAPGATFELVFTGADWQAGQHTNTATADYMQGITPYSNSDDANYFGELAITGPGVRTPGFWTNTKWQDFWDGDASVPKQAADANFPDADVVLAPVGADPGYVMPMKNGEAAILIGDFDLNGLADGADTILLSKTEALQILSANAKVSQDTQFVLGRDLVATWLNYLAGNPIDGPDSNPGIAGVQDPHSYIDEAIDWLKWTTGGSGNPLDPSTTPASNPAWNTGIDANGGGFNQNDAGDILAGNLIHSKLDEYNNNGSIDPDGPLGPLPPVVYALDGDLFV